MITACPEDRRATEGKKKLPRARLESKSTAVMIKNKLTKNTTHIIITKAKSRTPYKKSKVNPMEKNGGRRKRRTLRSAGRGT